MAFLPQGTATTRDKTDRKNETKKQQAAGKPVRCVERFGRTEKICAERLGRTEGRGQLFTAEQELVGPEL